MRRFALTVVMAAVVTLPAAAARQAPALERHEFVIRNFKTESGTVLPDAHVVYATLGRLNAARDNAVLQAFIPRVTFMSIPSLWGHTAGAGSNPADLKFLNEHVAAFLK